MSNTPDAIPASECGSATSLPVDPFHALLVRFGMLLGVGDFEALDGYHRGKTWLHTAWLHREGVIWGLDVQLDRGTDDRETAEVKVTPGLGVDRAGREVHLEQTACVHLGEWFDANRGAVDVVDLGGGRVQFTVHVTIAFQACLTRQVPALVEPCEGGSGTTTAYSRVFETVELLLRPGPAPERDGPGRPRAYPRLRQLCAVDPPPEPAEDGEIAAHLQEVLDARAAILALPATEQPAAYLAAFRRFAALDGAELRPAEVEEGEVRSLFPGTGDAGLVLAEIRNLTLEPQFDGGWRLVDSDADDDTNRVDIGVRPVHVATATLQELLCGPVLASGDLTDAGGPRVDPEQVALEGARILLQFDRPLRAGSVDPQAFAVTVFDETEGWSSVDVSEAALSGGGLEVTLGLASAPQGERLRVIARGTGPRPLLGEDLVPLAGATSDTRPGSHHDGRDFVHLLEL
jgi:hypothetical protein